MSHERCTDVCLTKRYMFYTAHRRNQWDVDVVCACGSSVHSIRVDDRRHELSGSILGHVVPDAVENAMFVRADVKGPVRGASIGVMSRRAYIVNPWGARFSAKARVSCHDVAERSAAGLQSGTRAS